MTWFGALGSVMFKLSSLRQSRLFLLAGLAFYGIGALFNIYLLGKLPYTVVMPANALTFVWTLLLARWLFKESAGMIKIAGVALIVSGIAVLVW